MKELENTDPVPGPFDDGAYRLVTLRVASTGALHVQLPTPGTSQPYASFNVTCTAALTTWIKKQPHEYGSLSGSGKPYVKAYLRAVDVKTEGLAARPNSPSALPEHAIEGLVRLQIKSENGPNYNVVNNGHDTGCDVILACPYAVAILKTIGG